MAVDELAQAFSVLTIGILSMPMSLSTTWARMHSCPVMRPAAAFPTTATSSASLSIPAEPNAPSTASRLSSFSPLSSYFPNRVIPEPTIATSLMATLLVLVDHLARTGE